MRTFRDLLRLISRNAGDCIVIKHLTGDNQQHWCIKAAEFVPAGIIANNTVMKLRFRFKHVRFFLPIAPLEVPSDLIEFRWMHTTPVIQVIVPGHFFARKTFHIDEPIDTLSRFGKNIDTRVIAELIRYEPDQD